MARVIAFAGSKGGTGKSTLSHLAAHGAGSLSRPIPTIVVTTDPEDALAEGERRYVVVDGRSPPLLADQLQRLLAIDRLLVIVDGVANRSDVDRVLSRIPLTARHLVGVELGVAEGGLGHGWSASGCRDRVRCCGVGSAGAVRSSRRGGSGTRHSVVGEWLDQRADRACVWCDAGQRAAVADVVYGRWCGWVVCEPAGWSGADQERGGYGFGTRGSVRPGDGPAELDLAAIASRTGGAQRRDDLKGAAQQGAEKGGSDGDGPATACTGGKTRRRSIGLG